MSWHAQNAENVIKHFASDLQNGLKTTQVDKHRSQYGANEIPKPAPKSKIKLFLEQFNDPIIYILIVAGLLNGFVTDWNDSIVIGVVVIINTMIGFFQELRAEDALKALENMTAPTARVIRDGKHLTIPTIELVCGDIVVLESGDRVPADARLIDSHNLLVDESMLTGESFAINKNHTKLIPENAPLGDRLTFIYSGTIIQKGRGLGIVTAVGPNSEFGKISQKVMDDEVTQSPLQEKMEKFSNILSITIMSIVVLIFLIGWLVQGFEPINMLLTSVGLAVSAIPEGLPVSITITLSIGLYQMAQRKAVIKKLAAVETLGSTNVICTDKTGTLTKNQMTVTRIYTASEVFDVSGSGYESDGVITNRSNKTSHLAKDAQSLELVSMIGALCTESHINLDPEKGNKEWKVTGDATEASVQILAEKLKYNKSGWNVSVDLPFESEVQFMAVRAEKGGTTYLLAKGAPERILERSKDMYAANGANVAVDSSAVLDKVKEFSQDGLRTIALAYAEIPNEQISLENVKNLTFVGFVGIMDSVREEVAEAVKDCHNAGVRVVMITGDHVDTARAIGKMVHIAAHKDAPRAVRGVDLSEMSDEQLFKEVNDIDVYARVAPEHKYRIVEQLKKQGHIVAMTGDGVNDAPALKKADIGIAMGSGSDVAKEASHMVLLDDNFTSIVNAIRRGRVILDNLQHILLYILATSFGGLTTIAASVFLGFPLPVLPAQLLWINLVTDGTNTFPLAFEKEHGNSMSKPPRPKESPLLSKDMIIRIVTAGLLMMIGTLGVYYYSAGDLYSLLGDPKNLSDAAQLELKTARTMAFCTLAFFQIWNVQNSRSIDRSLFWNLPGKNGSKLESIGITTNPLLLGVMMLAVVLQIAAVELPIMNDIMKTSDLDMNQWLIIGATTFSIIVIIEFVKLVTAFAKRS